MAAELCAINDGLEEDESPRRERYTLNLQRYEFRRLDGFNAASYNAEVASPDDEIRLPLYRSLCDTVQADIAGRQRPRPMFLTRGADWRTRRRAKKLDRFVEGILHQPHGDYANGWELATDVFLDAAALGICGIKVFVDRITEQVTLERVLPGRVKVDPREAETGCPKNWFDSYLMDLDQALEEFVESRLGMAAEKGGITEDEADRLRTALEAASVTDTSLDMKRYGATRIARSVKIREGWRAPISKDKPGVHAFAVPGALLWREDWKRDGPGIVWLRWSRERIGYYGVGLIDEAEPMVAEANRTAQHLQQRMKLLANRRTYVNETTAIRDEDLEANEVENIIRFSGTQPPIVEDIPPFHPSELDYKRDQIRDTYDLTGVPQGSAAGRKEQGIKSGVAIRMVRDMGTQRQAVKARNYEYAFVSLAKEIVACVAEWTDATGKEYEVMLPAKSRLVEIKWTQAKLDLDRVVVQVAPVSSLPNDPAGIMDTVGELWGQGLVSKDTYLRLIGWPDLNKEIERQSAEYEYLEQLTEKYLDAEPEDIKPGFFENPDGYLLNKPGALVQLAQAYFMARREGAPEFNLELLRRYMMRLDKLMQRAAAAQAPPAAGMPGAGMPGAPPGGLPGALPPGAAAPPATPIAA